jgi:hypothetical protein
MSENKRIKHIMSTIEGLINSATNEHKEAYKRLHEAAIDMAFALQELNPDSSYANEVIAKYRSIRDENRSIQDQK